MDVAFVYQLPSVKETLTTIDDLDEESSDLLVGLGVFTLVRDDDSVEWYVFANLKSPSSEDRVRVLAKLDRKGVRTDLRASDLMENPHLGLVATGPIAQIKIGVKRFLA